MKKETNKQIICRILELSDQDYGNMVFEQAYAYMQKIIPTDHVGMDYLSKNALFWAWWENQWNRRDAIFINRWKLSTINYILQPPVLRSLKAEYYEAHDIETLNIYPNRIVMDETYAIMIGQLIDKTNGIS